MMGYYRHVKRGSTYELLGRARMQIGTGDTADALEQRSFVVYRALRDNTLWVRPESEFFDGRFVKVNHR